MEWIITRPSQGLAAERCRRWPTTQRTPAEHWGAHWQQDLRHWAASL